MKLCSAKLENQKGSPLNFLKSLFLKCILWEQAAWKKVAGPAGAKDISIY